VTVGIFKYSTGEWQIGSAEEGREGYARYSKEDKISLK
jgi:hypothetical protein